MWLVLYASHTLPTINNEKSQICGNIIHPANFDVLVSLVPCCHAKITLITLCSDIPLVGSICGFHTSIGWCRVAGNSWTNLSHVVASFHQWHTNA